MRPKQRHIGVSDGSVVLELNGGLRRVGGDDGGGRDVVQGLEGERNDKAVNISWVSHSWDGSGGDKVRNSHDHVDGALEFTGDGVATKSLGNDSASFSVLEVVDLSLEESFDDLNGGSHSKGISVVLNFSGAILGEPVRNSSHYSWVRSDDVFDLRNFEEVSVILIVWVTNSPVFFLQGVKISLRKRNGEGVNLLGVGSVQQFPAGRSVQSFIEDVSVA